MAGASYQRSSFLGGIWSLAMQGRTERPDYITALNDCLNYIIVETGAAVRRSGTQFAGTTRNGGPGRVVKFDFQQTAPYTMSFTDGFLRFWSGASRVTTNDTVGITAISTANPAVVNTSAATPWATNDQVFFQLLGATCPLLQNRVFNLTKVDTTHFSLTDAITGATIDGSTLGVGSLAAAATISRILDIATPYVGGTWAALRAVQTEHTSFILHGSFAPYAVTVTALPSSTAFATFGFNAAVFNDGPYLDPFTNGVQATPSAKVGLINLTLAFPTYSATTAYALGAFVTYSGNNYTSLIDQNVNNQPDTHPSQWSAVNAATAISTNGFQGGDVGRLVRLYSEPDIWAVGTAYVTGNTVSYNPSGLPGASTYWQALANSTGKAPGIDTTNWSLLTSQAAVWSWGKITSLLNEIDRALAGSVNIGDMTGNGGLAAAFDGTTGQSSGACAAKTVNQPFTVGQAIKSYVGKNYIGASTQKIQQGTIYPASDYGFIGFSGSSSQDRFDTVVINLRAKATLPANSADGTLLGTASAGTNTTSPITIVSSDQTTAWGYVWFEIVATIGSATSISRVFYAAEAKFFNPPSAGTGNGVQVEILGPALLYTTAIRTWRLGVYSNTTGWPTCGTYSDGRLWLSGAVANRVDACYSNGISGGTFNFAPTDQYGVVTGASAINYTFNADDANPIFWMIPDLQGIICGTKAGEWLITAPTAGPITPLNIAARRMTRQGCANIEPRRTEHTTVFVQKFGRKIVEYFADVFSGKFTAPHLTEKGKHLSAAGISEIAYQQELAPIVWARLADGTMFGVTYKRDTLMTSQGPTITALHRHTLGSGRAVESITVGPSVGGNLDALAMVTNDAATGIRHVEILQDLAEETTALASHWLLDDAITPSSTTTSNVTPAPYGGLTLNGLWHLNGKTVTVFASGLDCGDYTVANGSIVVPYGDSVSAGTGNGLFTAAFAVTATIVVGFTYTSQAQIVRPHSREETGARNGPGFAKLRREHWYGIQIFNSTAATDGGIGTDFTKLDPVMFRLANGVGYTALQMFNGIHRATLRDTESLDSMICWQVTRPRPFNVAAIGGFVETKDL